MNESKHEKEWHPTNADAAWLHEVVRMLKVGARWILPSFGVAFVKLNDNTIQLEATDLTPVNPELATVSKEEIVRRTVIVGKKAGIKVIVNNG